LANETNVDITFFDVITNERWRKAMKEEMEAISMNHIWMLVKLPPKPRTNFNQMDFQDQGRST
jgi:hypothetical protein